MLNVTEEGYFKVSGNIDVVVGRRISYSSLFGKIYGQERSSRKIPMVQTLKGRS
jgi:hypothetical protein